MEAAVAQALERFGRLDIAIANAGFSCNGPLADLSVEDYRRQFDTNVLGVIRTVKAALPALAAARGSIGLVGSTNGYLSLPGYSPYCASKHAIRSLGDCLHHELAPQGVSVTQLLPGGPRWLQMPARRAAHQMLAAIAARKTQSIITLHARLAILAVRHTPWLIAALIRLARRPLIAASQQP
jgi:NAD(P)-dependent dehydrogenase (short-subunit alcohol dehydrogenase family)